MSAVEDSDRPEMMNSFRGHARRRLMDTFASYSEKEKERMQVTPMQAAPKSVNMQARKPVRSPHREVENEKNCNEWPTPRGQKALLKKRMAEEDPDTLNQLVMQRHPDMEFQRCRCDLIGGHSLVGVTQHEGELYVQVDDGLEDGEVLSLAPGVVGTLMGLSSQGETPRVCNDKAYVRNYVNEKYAGNHRPALNGDGAVVEAFNSPPGLKGYIQRRRKELRLALDRPRISLFHARAIISEFLDPAVEFNWAELRVMSLKKVIIDATRTDHVTSNKQFLSDYVLLALDLKKKWKSQARRPRSKIARPAADHDTVLPAEPGLAKRRRPESSSTAVGGNPRFDQLNRDSRRMLDPLNSVPLSSVRACGTGSDRPVRTKYASITGTVEETTIRQRRRGTLIDIRDSVTNPAGEVSSGHPCARQEQLEEEIAKLKELRDFAVKQFEKTIQEREVELESLVLGPGHDTSRMDQIENNIEVREAEIESPASTPVDDAPAERKTKRKLIWDVDLRGFT